MTRQQANVRRKKTYAAIAVILAIILLCVIGCAVYVGDYYHAEEAAVQAMASDDHITVSDAGDGVLLFLPNNPKAGLIFYPGGKVEYTAYAIEVVIEGGCHAGFGTYGPQDGDGTPSISSGEQIGRTAEEIQNMMQSTK